MVVGAIAPSSVNGVTMTGCPTEASSIIPSDMFASSWRGELVLIPPLTIGCAASSSRVTPCAMHAISTASCARYPPSSDAPQTLSCRVIAA